MSSFDDDDAGADDRERREAEALARALEAPGQPGGAAPADAVEVAGVLRRGRAPRLLAPDREAAVAARLEPALAARRARRRRRVGLWVASALAVPAAAAAALVLSPVALRAPAAPALAAAPPPPPPDLLRAQAAAAREGARALAALDEQMRHYRRDFLDGLERSRGGRR
jgi:hypothetical protein